MGENKPRELFKERNQRVIDAISLKESDRVPITPEIQFYPMLQKGMTIKEAMYDSKKSAQAAIEILSALNLDQVPTLAGNYSGKLFDALQVKFFKWPGAADDNQRLADHLPFQFVEGEYMKAEEYEDFFADPTGFLLKNIIPRHFATLAGFAEIPGIGALANGFVGMLLLPLFIGHPNVQKFLKNAQELINTFFSLLGDWQKYEKDMKKLGFPIQYANVTQAPFDIISEFLRGMRGSMLDMYRRPEDLLKLLDLIIEPSIKITADIAQFFPKQKVVMIPLHRGAEGFMNFDQFETFYWPSLTQVMESLIENGLIPMPFFEGKYSDRFEYLTDFAKKHKGKLIYWFDQSDIIKGKEMFGDYACIRGNVPATLLITGTTRQVEDYVKECIEGCMEGGGYIVDGGLGIPNEAKPENVKAMCEAVYKYGSYRK